MTPGTVRADGKVLREYGVYLYRYAPVLGTAEFVKRWFTYNLKADGVEVVPGTVEAGIHNADGHYPYVYALGWSKPRAPR